MNKYKDLESAALKCRLRELQPHESLQSRKKKKTALICANCITLDNLHNHFEPLFNPPYNLMLWNWYMLKFLLYRKYVSFSLLWLSLYHKGFRFLKTQQHCQWCDMITKKLVQVLAALIDVKIQSIRGMSQLDFSLVREVGCGTGLWRTFDSHVKKKT